MLEDKALTGDVPEGGLDDFLNKMGLGDPILLTTEPPSTEQMILLSGFLLIELTTEAAGLMATLSSTSPGQLGKYVIPT